MMWREKGTRQRRWKEFRVMFTIKYSSKRIPVRQLRRLKHYCIKLSRYAALRYRHVSTAKHLLIILLLRCIT